MTYGIEMLLFLSPPYLIGELITIISLVLLAEYYLFVKVIKKVKIEDKWLRLKVSI